MYLYDSPAPARVEPHPFTCDSDKLAQVLSVNGAQILDVCRHGDGFALAAGCGGIVLTDRQFGIRRTIATDGCCCAVRCSGKYVFSAESSAGFAVYEIGDGKAERISSTAFDYPVTQIELAPNDSFAVLGGGCGAVYAVDLKDIRNIKKVAERRRKRGLLYGNNFASHPLSDGTVILFWHRDGLVYYNPEKFDGFREIFYRKRRGFMGFGPQSGIDTDGERIYVNIDGGMAVLPMDENVFADELENHAPEAAINGKFILYGHKIYACERAKGEITVTDLSDPSRPRSLLRITTNASCGKPVEIDGKIYIPASHFGLLRLDV